jgi:hypothetical protein
VESEDTHKGDAESEDTHKGDAESEDTHKVDAESEDTHKGDAESEDTHKGDVESEDTHKNDAESKDTHKGDAESEDTHKGDVESEDTHKGDVESEDTHKTDARSHDDGDSAQLPAKERQGPRSSKLECAPYSADKMHTDLETSDDIISDANATKADAPQADSAHRSVQKRQGLLKQTSSEGFLTDKDAIDDVQKDETKERDVPQGSTDPATTSKGSDRAPDNSVQCPTDPATTSKGSDRTPDDSVQGPTDPATTSKGSDRTVADSFAAEQEPTDTTTGRVDEDGSEGATSDTHKAGSVLTGEANDDDKARKVLADADGIAGDLQTRPSVSEMVEDDGSTGKTREKSRK